MDRKFDVAAPNKVWATGITYVWTLEGWLYAAIVTGLFSPTRGAMDRQVAGWSIGGHMRASLCVNALQMAQGDENLGLAYRIILIGAANMQVTNSGGTWRQ